VDPTPARLRLRVAPGAHRAEVVGRHGNGWRLRVTAAPERGRANDEVVDLLAATLGVRRSQVTVRAGARSRDKLVELAGLDAAEAERRLQRAGRDR
jgi:uncharacterized protein (TIGR00251 family)